MKEIPLTQGYSALVDDEDYEKYAHYRWSALVQRRGNSVLVYAVRRGPTINAQRSSIRLHREILDAPKHMCVDHIDGDTLNNCRSNLRLCTNAENQRNRGPRPGLSSAFKGVRWHKKEKRWMVEITIDGKQKHIGCFVDEELAARAYDAAAVKYHGDFAWVNFQAATEAK